MFLGLQELYHELQILDKMEQECQQREDAAASNQKGYFLTSILLSESCS
jgi:hypothetical protein